MGCWFCWHLAMHIDSLNILSTTKMPRMVIAAIVTPYWPFITNFAIPGIRTSTEFSAPVISVSSFFLSKSSSSRTSLGLYVPKWSEWDFQFSTSSNPFPCTSLKRDAGGTDRARVEEIGGSCRQQQLKHDDYQVSRGRRFSGRKLYLPSGSHIRPNERAAG